MRGSLWDERLVYLGKELLFSWSSLILTDFSKEPGSSDLVSLGRVDALELEDPFILSLLVSLQDGPSIFTPDIKGFTIPFGGICKGIDKRIVLSVTNYIVVTCNAFDEEIILFVTNYIMITCNASDVEITLSVTNYICDYM